MTELLFIKHSVKLFKGYSMKQCSASQLSTLLYFPQGNDSMICWIIRLDLSFVVQTFRHLIAQMEVSKIMVSKLGFQLSQF